MEIAPTIKQVKVAGHLVVHFPGALIAAGAVYTFVSTGRDGCFTIAKGAAYSSLLSFFPILSAAAAILVQVNAQFAVGQMTSFLSDVLPPGTEEAVVMEMLFDPGAIFRNRFDGYQLARHRIDHLQGAVSPNRLEPIVSA